MNDEARDLLDRLQSEVEKLVTGEDWRRILDLSNAMHSYSFGNLLLIAAQRPNASMVAGYRRWQDLGRQVRRGERSIRVLAPVAVKRTDGETDEERRVVVGFRGVGVFDISQTDGQALPDIGPRLLTGEGPVGLLARVVELIDAEGYSFERGDCGGANGYTNLRTKCVRVRADVSPAQALKTALHELAHILMHAAEAFDYRACRGVAEVEAESVAYIVAGRSGLAADAYSFAYVAGWSKGDVQTVQATGTAVLKAAQGILDRLASGAEALQAA